MKESNIDRIFTTNEDEAEKIKASLKKTYLSQEQATFGAEREKTAEEAEIIAFLDQETTAVAQEFGGEGLEIPKNVVHIISEKEYDDLNENPDSMGQFSMLGLQGIIIKDKDLGTEDFTHILCHEMFHEKSFQSVRFNRKEKIGLAPRRVGFHVLLRKEPHKRAFVDLNEAVTEYFTQLMIRERWIKNRSILPKTLIEKTQNLNEKEFIKTFGVSYIWEQLSLMEIMDEIQKKYPEKYKNRDDIFKIFGEAYFTGKLLKLRKIVDKTFCAGSFVKFAKEGLPESKPEKENEAKN